MRLIVINYNVTLWKTLCFLCFCCLLPNETFHSARTGIPGKVNEIKCIQRVYAGFPVTPMDDLIVNSLQEGFWPEHKTNKSQTDKILPKKKITNRKELTAFVNCWLAGWLAGSTNEMQIICSRWFEWKLCISDRLNAWAGSVNYAGKKLLVDGQKYEWSQVTVSFAQPHRTYDFRWRL